MKDIAMNLDEQKNRKRYRPIYDGHAEIKKKRLKKISVNLDKRETVVDRQEIEIDNREFGLKKK